MVISMSTTGKLLSNHITIPRTDKGMRGGYCYRKTAHPRTPDEPQGYEDTEIADTLNIFDYTEARTPILVVQTNGKDRAKRDCSEPNCREN